MPTFTYQARDTTGRPQRGQQEAQSATALAGALRNRGWLVLNVQPVSAEPTATGWERYSPFNWLPPRSIDVELSFQQLAVMLRSGLTLLTALKTVADQANRPTMRRVWEDVGRRIQEGCGLADALAQHRCFPYLTVQLVRVGEQTGTLEVVVIRSAEAMERRRNLVTSLLTALAYPCLVLVAAFGVAGYMVFSVIPKLQQFLRTMGRQLPPMTQLLVDVTNALNAHLPHLVIALVAAIVGVIALYLWPPGRYWIDKTLLRVPIIGKVFRLGGTALFARGLSILVGSGVTLLEALRTVERLHRNQHIAAQVAKAREAVMNGGTLADQLTDRTAFMPMLSRMVAVGESAGTLEQVLEENAKFHEAQLERTIRWLSLMVEPAIIVVVGIVVGFVYISFFLALIAAGGGR